MHNDLLPKTFDYESYYQNLEHSLSYKNKTLKQWASFLRMPDISDIQSLDSAYSINSKALELADIIYENLALSKTTFLSSRSNYNTALLKARQQILQEIDPGKKLPSNESLEKQSALKCEEFFQIMSISEIVYEFWNTMSYKISQINARLTSLNILTNIEHKTSNY